MLQDSDMITVIIMLISPGRAKFLDAHDWVCRILNQSSSQGREKMWESSTKLQSGQTQSVILNLFSPDFLLLFLFCCFLHHHSYVCPYEVSDFISHVVRETWKRNSLSSLCQDKQQWTFEKTKWVHWRSWSLGSVIFLKIRDFSTVSIYSLLIRYCMWGLLVRTGSLGGGLDYFVLRTETLSLLSARTNNSKQLIQLGPSLTRLHQIKMRTLLLLLLFCHVSSPGKITF